MKTTKSLSRILAAIISSAMVISCAVQVSAEGWENTGDAVTYTYQSGKKADSGLYRIDGVLYKFSGGNLVGKYSGNTVSSGVRRRYKNGLPYTGWVKNKSGRKYCLDGCFLTGSQQIGKYIYNFGSDGITDVSKRTLAPLTAKVNGTVFTDTEKISVSITNNSGDEIEFGFPDKLQKLVKGKWTDVKANENYAVDDVAYVTSKDYPMQTVTFYPLQYTDKLTAGYYRLNVKDDVYAVFEVKDNVKLTADKNIFYGDGNKTELSFTAVINPDDMPENYDFSLKLYVLEDKVWTSIIAEDIVFTMPVDEDVYAVQINCTTSKFEYNVPVKAVLSWDDFRTETYFNIDKITAVPQQEVYSLTGKDITVYFDVYNKSDEDILVYPNVYNIYYRNNLTGKFEEPEATCEIDIDDEPVTLKPGERMTVRCRLGTLYDVSTLKAGTYYVFINGCGRTSFVLSRES
jgi:hypothetical protein